MVPGLVLELTPFLWPFRVPFQNWPTYFGGSWSGFKHPKFIDVQIARFRFHLYDKGIYNAGLVLWYP